MAKIFVATTGLRFITFNGSIPVVIVELIEVTIDVYFHFYLSTRFQAFIVKQKTYYWNLPRA